MAASGDRAEFAEQKSLNRSVRPNLIYNRMHWHRNSGLRDGHYGGRGLGNHSTSCHTSASCWHFYG